MSSDVLYGPDSQAVVEWGDVRHVFGCIFGEPETVEKKIFPGAPNIWRWGACVLSGATPAVD